MLPWQPNIERDSLSEHVDCGSLCSSMRRRVKSVWYFYMRKQELYYNTFSSQFPLNAVISHLRKTVQSPLSTVIDWPVPRLPSPHLVLTCLLFSLYPSLFVCMCVCVNMCMFRSVRPLGTAPVRFPDPFQKALFTLRDLWEPALLKASQDIWKEGCRAGECYCTNHRILLPLMHSDIHKTLFLKLFELGIRMVNSSSITKTSL